MIVGLYPLFIYMLNYNLLNLCSTKRGKTQNNKDITFLLLRCTFIISSNSVKNPIIKFKPNCIVNTQKHKTMFHNISPLTRYANILCKNKYGC